MNCLNFSKINASRFLFSYTWISQSFWLLIVTAISKHDSYTTCIFVSIRSFDFSYAICFRWLRDRQVSWERSGGYGRQFVGAFSSDFFIWIVVCRSIWPPIWHDDAITEMSGEPTKTSCYFPLHEIGQFIAHSRGYWLVSLINKWFAINEFVIWDIYIMINLNSIICCVFKLPLLFFNLSHV